jgi:ABC-type sugar transport system ATPase subunit
VHQGEFVVLLGESGCGKSTTLRMIAGLDEVSEGRIFIGGRDVTDLPPKARDIAMVFQNYALYPHMDVAHNMSFALRLAGRPAEIDAPRGRRRGEGAEHRRTCCSASPRSCRAASASAWPSAAPSCASRRSSCSTSRCPTWTPSCAATCAPNSRCCTSAWARPRIYVTHDQVEAMTLADRIVIFDKGRIQQVGTPLKGGVQPPANLFVAGFIGTLQR